MQELHRFQKLSMQAPAAGGVTEPPEPTPSVRVGAALPVQPPVAPPTSLYANLPSEWPLARISVWMRHISVLLRVTLYRRLAELSFRGVDFTKLPREVVRHTRQDFDNLCGAMAAQLAALFAFLKSNHAEEPEMGCAELALYADPSYWLYGLLSFCAKSCEAKTAEVGGQPIFKTSKEGKKDCTTPVLEPTRNSLALMQTVVMSFVRGLYQGKAELPIDHVHIYFPVQVVHKVDAQCIALGFNDVTPEEGKRYKHNVDNVSNNPYIIARAYEGQCTAVHYPPIPHTSKLAEAYENGMLDGSFGQVVSFASYYQTSFPIEVPLWHKVEDGVALLGKEQQGAALPMLAKPVLPDNVPSPVSSSDAITDPLLGADKEAEEAEEEEAEEETYLPATGQGCYSFQMSLLQRAAQTFLKRSLGDKYGQVAKWLLTGLAVAVSRKSWHLLSKHRTCTVTPLWLLREHFQHGYVSAEKDDAKKPYAAAYVQSLYEHTWEALVTKIIRKGYIEATNKFRTAREERDEIEFYSTIDQTNPLRAPPEAGQGSRSQASSHSHQ